VVDDDFAGRASFGGSFTEATNTCPTRAGPEAVGDCHTITWDGNGGFTGAFWVNGTGFPDMVLTDVDPGATVLKFSAWRTAASLDTAVEFGFGLGTNGDGGAADGVEVRRFFNLGETPTEYEIPLAALGGYPNGVAGPFLFVLDTGASEIYIDDIRWEAVPEQTLPMTVDEAFPGRGGFSASGDAVHTETTDCPMRSSAEAVGDCHKIVYDGSVTFTGALWLDGDDFANAEVVPIEAGATSIKFSAWGAAGGESIEFGAGDNALDGAQIRQLETLANTPTEYTLSVAGLGAAAGGLKAGFQFAAFDQAVEFYIDDIRWTDDGGGTCVPPALPNLTVNGDFETGDTCGWEFFPNDGTFAATQAQSNGGAWSGNLVASVPGGGGPPSFPVIKQANIGIGTVQPNSSVDISFDLFGSVSGAGGVFVAEFFSELCGGGTSSSVVLGQPVPTGTWTNHSFNTPTGNDVCGGVTLQLKADCGANPGCTVDAYIDNVSVTVP
jgi:hypothetical protein